MVVDEASFVTPEMFTDVIVPTMALRNTALSMISSKAVDESSPVNRIMTATNKVTGRPIFKVKRFMQICSRCRMQSRMDCTHKPEMPWSDYHQTNKIRAIMGENSEAYQREILNLQTNSAERPAFSRADIARVADRRYYLEEHNKVDRVFIGIDPCGGGDASKFAIASLARVAPFAIQGGAQSGPDADLMPRGGGRGGNGDDDGIRRRRGGGPNGDEFKTVVVGLEFRELRQARKGSALLIEHLRALRRQPSLRDALFVIVPENNLGFEAQRIADDLKHQYEGGRFVVFQEDHSGKDGLRTTHELKGLATTRLGDDLENDRFFIGGDLVTVGSRVADSECSVGSSNNNNSVASSVHAREVTTEELLCELRQFRRIVKPPRGRIERARVFYSGKAAGCYDDLLMALLVADSARRHIYDYLASEPQQQQPHQQQQQQLLQSQGPYYANL